MWMSVLIILVCVQNTLTVESLNGSVRIKRGGNSPEDEISEQYDKLDNKYEDEELSDSSVINKSFIKEESEGEELKIKNNNASNNSLPSLPQLREMIRLVRAALPSENSSKIDEAESDLEEEEEFEEAENIASTEEQYEAEAYDSVQPTERGKLISNSDKSKRYRTSIDAKHITESLSPDLIEIGDDESLNENDGEEYGEFFPTRKEIMTLRTRQQRITSRSSTFAGILSITTKPSKIGIAKDEIHVANDTNVSKQVSKKIAMHGRKGKLLKTKETLKSASKNSRSSDFEELKKAYNALVCSVENFMGLANKTMLSNASDNSSSIKDSSSTIPAYCRNDSSLTTLDVCANLTSKLECLTTCDDIDFAPAENRKPEEDEDINSNSKKKHKGVKIDYSMPDDPVEKSGSYVYNDYDSIDSGDYDTDAPFKSTSPRSSIIDRTKHSSLPQTTQNKKNKSNKDHSKSMSLPTENDVSTRGVSTASRSSFSTSEATEEAPMSWKTFHYETKIKLRPSRRHARRMSTESSKILSRRKYLSRHRKQQEEPKEAITQSGLTNYPIVRNLPPSHEGDTEIIEVEYV